MSTKILLIAPGCYPVNGAEEIVNIKMLQAFASTDNFEVDLVSKVSKNYNYPSGSIESLGIKLHNLSLCEVDNKVNFKTIWQHFLCFLRFGVVQKGDHWSIPAYKAIKNLLKTNHYDYVLTKNSPSYLLGYYLKKNYKVKWVATWNDPFPRIKYPEPYGKGAKCKESWMAKRVIGRMKCADIHIFPSGRLRDHMLKYLKVDMNRCAVIPHAVIGSDNRRFVQNYQNGLNLIHSGNLSMPRNPETTLRALRLFFDKYPDAPLTFTVLGKSNPIMSSLVDELHLKEIVRYINPVEYNKSLEIVSQYNVAVIIEADCPEGVFLPTKVTDFLQIGIPIFSISPSVGVLNDLSKEGCVSYFASVNNTASICSSLEMIYQDFQNKNLPSNIAINEPFSSKYICEKYASFANSSCK